MAYAGSGGLRSAVAGWTTLSAVWSRGRVYKRGSWLIHDPAALNRAK